jgi:hypothetical protein
MSAIWSLSATKRKPCADLPLAHPGREWPIDIDSNIIEAPWWRAAKLHCRRRPLANLCNKQRDGPTAAEVLTTDIQ